MASAILNKASAIIIGGGAIGASVAYHLAKLGRGKVLLLERMQLSCGTTWHAYGRTDIDFYKIDTETYYLDFSI